MEHTPSRSYDGKSGIEREKKTMTKETSRFACLRWLRNICQQDRGDEFIA